MTTRREALARLRNTSGLTQCELADRVGITQQYYSLIEKGDRTPKVDVALRIAKALNADPRVLFADVLDADEEAATLGTA